MSMITDLIMKQMNTIGEPKTSTMTENISQQSNEPMNLGNLALMMWLMMGDKGKTTSALGETPMPSPLSVTQPSSGGMGVTPSPTGMGAQSNPMDFIRMLLSSLGGGR